MYCAPTLSGCPGALTGSTPMKHGIIRQEINRNQEVSYAIEMGFNPPVSEL